MTFKYKLIQRKDFSEGALEDAKLYYAQAVNNGTVSTKELCENIAEESALTSADVNGVFNRLVRQLRTHLQNGRTVVIDGFGSFRLTIGSKGAPTMEEFDAATMMKKPRITFTPHLELKDSTQKLTFVRVNKPEQEGGEG